MNIHQILEKTISHDQNELRQAFEFLEQFARSNFPEFIKALSDVLANVEINGHVRMSAGLQLKNQLTSKDELERQRLQQLWLHLPVEIRNQVKSNTLNSLGTENNSPSAASQCVAYIAAIELPHRLWPDLMGLLTKNATTPDVSEQAKVANLEAIGYICQEVSPELLVGESNQILTAIVNNMRKEVQSSNVKFTATTALLNSLEFTKANFETENERHYIMQVVCEATQFPDPRVQVASLQCLVKIMSLYYQHMEHYMASALFPITMQAIKSESSEISLQGIEFWSNVCDEEIELSIEASEASDQGRPPLRTSKFYAKGALQYLVPLLLNVLTKQDEDSDEDEWNPCKAASVCLALLANCTEDDIINHALPFITKNIAEQDWHLREAAMMAFGSVMEGPSQAVLVPIVQQAFPTVLSLMHDKSVIVRDTTTWVLSKICEQVSEVVLRPDVVKLVLDSLLEALKSEPRVAVNACWALSSLSESANELACNIEEVSENPKSNALSPTYEIIITHLYQCTDRPDSGLNNLRTSAYEALMEMIKNSPKDCYPIVRQTTLVLLDRLNRILPVQADQNIMELQSLLCSALQTVLRKMTAEDGPKIADNIMTAIIHMLDYSTKMNTINEDALLVGGTLAEILQNQFLNLFPPFKGYLIAGLKSFQNTQLCSASIGVVVDICNALGKEFTPFCDEIIETLMEILANEMVQRKVKTEVLSVFGDIAIAIGPEFKKYLNPVLMTLAQASSVQINAQDFEMMEYIHDLWESTLHAYTFIVQALKGDGDTPNPDIQLLHPHVAHINQFLLRISEHYLELPENIISAACGLIGDMVSVFGMEILVLLEVNFVQMMFNRGKKSKSTKARNTVTWAMREVRKVKNLTMQHNNQQQAQANFANQMAGTATAESCEPPMIPRVLMLKNQHQ